MHSQPKTCFVSVSLPIGGKQETDGHKSGNGEEPKPSLLCRNGNGEETGLGNEGGFFVSSRFQEINQCGGFPPRSTQG